jgi:hypothetical protein
MGQTGRRSIATHILAVKIDSAATHFHGFGVARQGPWITVEKPLYAPSEHPSRTQKTRHCSVLALMSKCLNAVLDYRLVL